MFSRLLASAPAFAVVALSTAIASAHGGARTEANDDGPASDPRLESHWSKQRPRAFVSGRIDAGIPYAKPQVAAGYGKPHDTFVAVEAFGLSTNTFGAGYVGVRFELPFLWVTAGPRYTASYLRGYLDPRESFLTSDVEAHRGSTARYWAFDADVGGYLPAPGGGLLWNVLATAVTNAPAGTYLFEESTRAVMATPWVVTGRLGYLLFAGPNDVLKVGVLSEYLSIPARRARIVRVGPIAALKITDHLDAIATVTLVVASPDNLSLTQGAWGIAGVRYKWASGDPAPSFP